MPCYDFTLIINPTFPPAFPSIFIKRMAGGSGIADSLGVTGGEYKTRERIQRDMADSRLLAIPTS
jgi:hypothetical protein